MASTIGERVKRLHDRLAGTKIRQQVVESVEVVIDTNGAGWTARYFVFAHFREPELPQNMMEELKMLRRVFWDHDYAQVSLDESEFELFLDGAMEVPEHQWRLSDELRGE